MAITSHDDSGPLIWRAYELFTYFDEHGDQHDKRQDELEAIALELTAAGQPVGPVILCEVPVQRGWTMKPKEEKEKRNQLRRQLADHVAALEAQKQKWAGEWFFLAHCYMRGRGVTEDPARAAELYRKARREGCKFAEMVAVLCDYLAGHDPASVYQRLTLYSGPGTAWGLNAAIAIAAVDLWPDYPPGSQAHLDHLIALSGAGIRHSWHPVIDRKLTIAARSRMARYRDAVADMDGSTAALCRYLIASAPGAKGETDADADLALALRAQDPGLLALIRVDRIGGHPLWALHEIAAAEGLADTPAGLAIAAYFRELQADMVDYDDEEP